MSHPPLIDDPAALPEVARSFGALERIGLDAEGDGFFRYRSRLCTLQLAGAGEVAVIDTLAIEDLSPLGPLLAAEGPVKVVHDVAFDARMLAGRGMSLGRVFDTAVAARFLGEPSTGLAAMLEKHFEVTLDKQHQTADWGARPLSAAQLAYLVDDVRHLPALARDLEARARELDVLEEIDEETRYAMERALDPEPVRPPWTRIKGARDLSARQLAALVALADAREREAEARDVPPFRVTGNRVLLEAARRSPRTVADLRRIRGLRSLPDQRLAEALEAAERDGPPLDDPTPPPPPEERARKKAREKALGQWRSEEAERRGVDPQVILPGHCLRDLAQLEDPDAIDRIPGLGDKRLGRYGDALRAIVRGG